MSTAYDPSQWHDLFVAACGASAALAGLVFVAISINIDRILKLRGVPERGLETVMLLVLVLITSIAGLIPGQGHTALGLELLGIALLAIAFVSTLPPIGIEGEPRVSVVSRWLIRVASIGVLLVGALGVTLEAGGGLYWVAAAIGFAIVGAVSTAWVLLVEILR